MNKDADPEEKAPRGTDLAGALRGYAALSPVPDERDAAWDAEVHSRHGNESRRGAGAQSGEENEIGTRIIEAAIRIHQALGPGLLESVYEVVLAHELGKMGLACERQVVVPIEYDGLRFDEGFRADLVVGGKVIVELKCVEHLSNAHKKQLLTYLRLTGCRLGYLLNFSEELMKYGIHRIVNGLPE